MIVCDTSTLVALANQRDRDYARMRSAAENAGAPYIVPAATLGEVAFFIESRMRLVELETFLADREARRYTVDAGDADFARVRYLGFSLRRPPTRSR